MNGKPFFFFFLLLVVKAQKTRVLHDLNMLWLFFFSERWQASMVIFAPYTVLFGIKIFKV